jgi:mitofusin 2
MSSEKAQEQIDRALDRVGRDEIGIVQADVMGNSKITTVPRLPSYPGLLSLWEYARAVLAALIGSIDLAVKLAEDEARVLTTAGVNAIVRLGETHLPQSVECSRHVFMPEAMFVPRVSSKGSKRMSGNFAVVAGKPKLHQLDEPTYYWQLIYCTKYTPYH